MKPVFADTYFFLAILNPRDSGHADAVACFQRGGVQILTTQWVLVEVGDALSSPSARQNYTNFIVSLPLDSEIEVLAATSESFHSGFDLYRNRPDKHGSLTDCISFAVMQEHGVREALTADHHFEQAGFVALLNEISPPGGPSG